MLERLRKAVQTTQNQPAFFITQEVKFPVYLFDLHGEVDNQSILSRVNIDWESSNRTDIVIDGYQSPYITRSHIDYNKFADLLKVVEDKCNVLKEGTYKMYEYWYVAYKKNSKQNWHDHSSADPKIKLSGVYYAKMDKDSAPLLFLTQGKKSYKFYPKQEQLILFDSRLNHSVPHNESDSLRISFAFNLERL